jgi:predicted nucleic-acid-binding protein
MVRDHEQQTDSAEKFIADGAWISLVALTESIWVLQTSYQYTHNELTTVIDMLLDHAQLVIQDQATVAAALDRYRSHPGLGFSDCLLFQIANDAGHLPFGTFDRKLARIEGAVKL